MVGAVTPQPATPAPAQIWAWLEDVPDPEIPVISVVDLGIVRDVNWRGGELVVTVTPTYSGCPANSIIQFEIERALRERGVPNVRLERRLSPAWTTAWLTEKGREKLRAFGIAPPVEGTARRIDGAAARPAPACPRCGSENTARVSEFGSTPCKAQHRCADCLEPFDYFKCI